MPTIAEDFAEILSAVRRPGDFYASGRIELLAPRIEVESVGPIALPLLPVQAEQLIAAAEQAPYGHGADTLVDTAVRRTWQIGSDRVRIAGKHWPRTFDEIVTRAAEGLGVSEPVAAELYKLLVYDEGSFFVSHRDTEKAPGMFATLVLALPSQSAGGELVVRHKGRETRLDLRCEEPSEIAFAAFYADCVHEVLPVTSGCRATLVYNLVRQEEGARPEPPSYEGEAAETTSLLRGWADGAGAGSDGAPKKLIYPLEHAYTSAELGFGTLKGADAAIAGLLRATAPQAGCDLHLALLTIEESGAAEYVGSYGSSRWQEPELEAGEVFDRYEALCEWRRPDGEPSTLGALPIEEAEICSPDALDDMEPDEEHFHEATGNEGASFDRTYRRAALVLWPSKQVLAVLNQAGLPATLPYLADLVARWRRDGAASDSPLRRQAVELVEHMLATWPTRTWYSHDSGSSEMSRMLSLLSQLGDKKGADRLFVKLIAQGGHGKADNDAILDALGLFSLDRAAERLRRIVAASAVSALGACSALLAGAVRSRFASKKPAKLVDAVAALVEALPGDPSLAPKDQFGRPKGVRADAGVIVDLVGVLDAVDGSLARRTANHLLAWPTHYHLDKVLVPAACRLIESGMATEGEVFEILHAACLAHLKSRVAEPLEAPRDWSRPSDISCKCEHCSALGRFLEDLSRPTWSLKAAAHVRNHVEGTIRNARSDVDVRTERRGSPHTLICTKNQASYERRVAQRKKDLADIKTLER
jgi:predicted 2-oxoglutarate/Fe(II)-dependent dioxygenase YbiX